METSSSARFYYHPDGLGSVTNMTNASGAKQWTYVWEPFGTTRTETKNASSAPTNLMRFAGEHIDTATSLYHLRARQYDPATGRFLSTDPIAQPLSDPYVSSYVYANNSPTVLVDPSGLDSDRATDDGSDEVECPWPSKLPFIGDEYCEGFRTLGPSWQGITGATVTAGPPALGVAAVGTPAAGNALIRLAGTHYGKRLLGHPAYHGVRGGLNRGQVRVGVGRHNGPVFRIGIRRKHLDWPR